MRTCWQILGIQPTRDVDQIKTARRTLIKSWHPDIATTAADKTAYTARCAEINAAFDEAVMFAEAWQPAPENPLRASNAPNVEFKRPRPFRPVRSSFASTPSIAVAMIFFFIVASRTTFRLTITLTLFVLPLAIVAAVDWLLFFMIRSYLAARGDGRFPHITWAILAAANVTMLSLGLAEMASVLFGFAGGAIFDLVVALGIPLWIGSKRILSRNSASA